MSDAAASNRIVWDKVSLGSGMAGVALFHLVRAERREDDVLLGVAFDCVRYAVQRNNEAPSGALGLLSGASGLALVLNECARQESRFRPSAQRMHERVVDATVGLRWEFVAGRVPVSMLDMISGLAGLLTYHATTPWSGLQTRVALDHVLHYTCWLLSSQDPVHAFSNRPADYPPGSVNARDFPDGHAELGVAHGLAGLLHALCLAWSSGRASFSVLETVRRVVDEILVLQERSESDVTVLVPDHAGLGTEWAPAPPSVARTGWCRGGTGLWTAVRSAASVLADDTLERTARASAHASALQSLLACTEEPSLCHGLAGTAVALSEGTVTHGVEPSALVTAIDRLAETCRDGAPEVSTSNGSSPDMSFLSGLAGVGATAELLLGGKADWSHQLGMR